MVPIFKSTYSIIFDKIETSYWKIIYESVECLETIYMYIQNDNNMRNDDNLRFWIWYLWKMNEEMLLSYLINLFVRSFVTIYHQVLNAYIEKLNNA